MSNNHVELYESLVKYSLGKELNNAVPVFYSGLEFINAVQTLRNSALYGKWYFTAAPPQVAVAGSVANLYPFLVFALMGKVVSAIDLNAPTSSENPFIDVLFDEVYLSTADFDAVTDNVVSGALTYIEALPAGGIFLPNGDLDKQIVLFNNLTYHTLEVNGSPDVLIAGSWRDFRWVFDKTVHFLARIYAGAPPAIVLKISITHAGDLPFTSVWCFVNNDTDLLIPKILVDWALDPNVTIQVREAVLPGPERGVWRRGDYAGTLFF